MLTFIYSYHQESKLTRLLQLAKRSIENSKREQQEKDRLIEKQKEEVGDKQLSDSSDSSSSVI